MSVSLSKGGNVSLSKEEPGLARALIGLGWDARTTDGAEFDLDASAFLLDTGGRVRSDADFIFYNNLRSPDGSVEHTGDNRTGDGEVRRQSFGMVSNAFIRVVNDATGREIARYDLSEDASTETAMVFGEIYRHNGEWKFRAVGQGFKGGLAPLARGYGVNIG